MAVLRNFLSLNLSLATVRIEKLLCLDGLNVDDFYPEQAKVKLSEKPEGF